MANRVTMELTGLKELDFALREMLPRMQREKVILRALHDGARPITAEAKRRAPVLKVEPGNNRVRRRVVGRSGKERVFHGTPNRERGALRAGITQHTDRSDFGTVKVRVRNRGYIFGPAARRGASSAAAGNPNYWWLVHFGTSKMKANPFLYDAFEAKKTEAAAKIRVSLLRGVLVVGLSLGFDVRSWVDV